MRSQILRWCLAGSVLLGTTALAGAPTAVWFEAEDGVKLRADLYALKEPSAPMILLFHQAGSNRAEYAQIAPRLNELGFHALALDQRSGGSRWGSDNDTVNAHGESTDYLSALPDLVAALEWKKTSGYVGKTVVWGSSYSAALVFLLAAEHEGIEAILSFSPGEYLGTRTDEVRKQARKISRPVLILTPRGERDRAKAVFDVISGEDKELIIPEQAVHGSSMLVPDRNPGADAIWPKVEAFLARFSG